MNDIIGAFKNASDLIAGKGATEEQISAAEEELELAFADEYKEYLRTYGAAMAGGHAFTGISEAIQLDVVRVTEGKREAFENCPQDMYVIENLAIDDRTIWQKSDGDIYAIHDGQCEKICDSYAAYIQSILM